MRSSVLLRVILFVLAANVAFGAVIVVPGVTFDTGLYTYDYSLTNTESSLAIIIFQLTISGSYAQVLAPNEEWIWATFPVGSETGIQWSTLLGGIPPGGALSGFRVISPDAPGPATFSAEFDSGAPEQGSTQGPGTPEPAGATLVGLGLVGLLAARLRLRRRGEALRGGAAPSRS